MLFRGPGSVWSKKYLEVLSTMRVLEFEKAGQKASNTLTRRFIDSGFFLFGIQGQRQIEPGAVVMRPNIS